MASQFTPRTAKDFLISRIGEEAQRQGAPLSEVERKMLYWTEMDESGPEAHEVNDTFEREFDRAEYEAKIAKLLKQAYRRDKKESKELAEQWKDAIRVLQRRDHYLTVMVDQSLGSVYTITELIRYWLTALVTLTLGTVLWLVLGLVAGAHHEYQPSKTVQVVTFVSGFLLIWIAIRSDRVWKIIEWVFRQLGPARPSRRDDD